MNPENMPPGMEPILTVETDKFKIEAPRSRTVFYTFLGKTALDHMFLVTEKLEDGRNRGAYIFREDFGNHSDEEGNDAFDQVLAVAVNSNFQAILNSPDVPEGDMAAYIEQHPIAFEALEAEEDPAQITQEIVLPDKLEIPDFLPEDFK